MSAVVIEAANKIQSYAEHLERCFESQPGLKTTTDFYAHLASETGRSANELMDLFKAGLSNLSSELQNIIDQVSVDSSSDLDVSVLVQAASLMINFKIAYDELIPPPCHSDFAKLSDLLSDFLESENAIDDYPSSIRSVDSPVIRRRRYNLEELLAY